MTGAAAAGTHVFLVRSSLQFLLATALAADLRERTHQPCRMLFLPDMLDPGLFIGAVPGWAESPFDQVLSIAPRRLPGADSAAPRRDGGAVRRELEAAFVAARPLSLTVFNDREEAGQALLIAAARHFPQAERRCAEDGSLAYTGFGYRAHGVATRLRQQLRLGRQWHDVQVLGTHPLVQQFLALHPRLLRAELRERAVQPIATAALASPALRSLAAAMCAAAGFAPQSVPDGATVLTLGHSSYAARNPDYLALVQACAQQLGRRREAYFFKYHPREAQPDYLGLGAGGQAREIARALPVECLYLMLRDRALTVVGGMSSTLLTAGLLAPRLRCAALVHASASGDRWDPRLLDALRITPLADAAAIGAYFGGGSTTR